MDFAVNSQIPENSIDNYSQKYANDKGEGLVTSIGVMMARIFVPTTKVLCPMFK